MLSPIVVFCYNRPEHIERTLEALSKNALAEESTLYVFCDGPKKDASDDQRNLITQVRQIVRKKQWCKDVIVTEAEENKGLRDSIISGVSSVIQKHGTAIVVEDD